MLPAAVNGLKTSRHLPSPPLYLLWTPHYSLAVQLPAHQLQVTLENQFQNIRCSLRFRKLLGPGVPQQLGVKISPRKAAKTSIGCTAGFELQINSEKEKKSSVCVFVTHNLDTLMLKIKFCISGIQIELNVQYFYLLKLKNIPFQYIPGKPLDNIAQSS